MVELWFLFLLVPGCFAAPALKSYDVELNTITASGVSSGGAVGTQLHVAHSAVIKAFGSIASPPYYCAQGTIIDALNLCMMFADNIDVSELTAAADDYASRGLNDPTSNMAGQKVFIIHGTEDPTVDPAASPKVEEFYAYYGADMQTLLTIEMGHAVPTWDTGLECADSGDPWINRCGYDAAFEMLNFFYGGGLQRPDYGNVELSGQFLEYDQNEFAGSAEYLDTTGGYLYVPSGCRELAQTGGFAPTCDVDSADRRECGFSGINATGCADRACCWKEEPPFYCYHSEDTDEQCNLEPGSREECGFSGIDQTECEVDRQCCWREELPYHCYKPKSSSGGNKCKLHLFFHGCIQGREDQGDYVARNSGFLETAELNNIIVVFPQAMSGMSNPNGCWDWWGYEDEDYANQNGLQVQAVKRMMDRIAGTEL